MLQASARARIGPEAKDLPSYFRGATRGIERRPIPLPHLMTSKYSLPVWRRCCGAFLFLLTAWLPAAPAESPRRAFDLPPGNALVTLKQFIAQSGAQLLYSADEVEDTTTRPVKGVLTALEALRQMLAGTRLEALPDERAGALAILAPVAFATLSQAALIVA